jgi:8-oxo-dGTP pyrophosphatase MutT (NUDIX family)
MWYTNSIYEPPNHYGILYFMNRRIAVRGIIVHEGKLLCAKLSGYNGRTHDYWCTLGGGIDNGEALHPALQREMVEETGIMPVIGNLLFIQQYGTAEQEYLEFFFHIQNVKDFVNIDHTKSSHGAKEIEQLEFVDPRNYDVRPSFLTSIDFSNFDPNTSVKIFNYFQID